MLSVYGQLFGGNLLPDDFDSAWRDRGGASGVLAAMRESPYDRRELCNVWVEAFEDAIRQEYGDDVEIDVDVEVNHVGASREIKMLDDDGDDSYDLDAAFEAANAALELRLAEIDEQARLAGQKEQ